MAGDNLLAQILTAFYNWFIRASHAKGGCCPNKNLAWIIHNNFHRWHRRPRLCVLAKRERYKLNSYFPLRKNHRRDAGATEHLKKALCYFVQPLFCTDKPQKYK